MQQHMHRAVIVTCVCVQKSLLEFKEGMVFTGTVNAIYFNHGIKVDIGGVYDGCAPAAGGCPVGLMGAKEHLLFWY